MKHLIIKNNQTITKPPTGSCESLISQCQYFLHTVLLKLKIDPYKKAYAEDPKPKT